MAVPKIMTSSLSRLLAMLGLLSSLYVLAITNLSLRRQDPVGEDEKGKAILITTNVTDPIIDHQSNITGVLFLIFCGGPSGKADMNAILDTWGQHLERAVIMSNTPHDLPTERLAMLPHWRVQETPSLNGGRNRDPKESWIEIFQLMSQEMRRDPQLGWIVRSDSDTWWNVHRLHQQLRKGGQGSDLILPSNEASIMGQFFPLVNFSWVKGISNRAMKGGSMYRDSGRNAYLSGGAGLIFTRSAVETFAACFSSPSSLERLPTDLTVLEDIWLSRPAFECNVSLVRSDKMYQFPMGAKPGKVPSTISIHRAAGDGRKSYVHPSYYEEKIDPSRW